MAGKEHDRRGQRRYLGVTAAGIKREDAGEHLAVVRDASATGAQVLVRGHFAVGDEVTLGVLFRQDQPVVEVHAREMRAKKVDEGLWSYRLGLEFTETRHDLVPAFEKLVRG